MKIGRSFLFGILRFGLAAAVLIWLQASGFISWPVLRGLLVAWPITVAAIAVFAVDVVITASRLCVLLRPTGAHLSLPDAVRLGFISLFFAITSPGGAGADAARIYYASIGNQGSRAELATVILLDRAVGMFALFLWPVLASPFCMHLLGSTPLLANLVMAAAASAAALFAVTALMMSASVRRHTAVVWLFSRMPLGTVVERMVDTLHGYRRHPAALAGAVAISLVAHTLAIATCLLLARAIDPDGFSWRMSILIPLGFLANALPFTPGGLGVGEAALAGLFRIAGLRGGPPIMLGWRMIMLLISLSGMFFYLAGEKRLIHLSAKATPLPDAHRS